MNHENISERFEELRLLIDEQDLSRSSRRILDFFTDFPLPHNLKRAAITLRADYNAYALLDQASATSDKLDAMLMRAASLTNDISQHLLKQNYISETGEEAGHAIGGEFFHTKGRQQVKKGEAVFLGKNISKTFRTPKYTFQLPELDLELRLGEVTGIVGENGNGKTTLLRIVAGDLEADAGEMSYPAFQVPAGDWYRTKQHIAYIPQQLKPWQGFLKENLHFSAAIHGIRGQQNEEQVNFIIHRLGLTKYEEALWNEVSSGFKLRFTLARALVWKPLLLIIDEPLANLDINTQQIFLQDLRYLANSAQNPMAILVTSQHLHEVESIADNIIFMKNGEALYNGAMQDFGQDRAENLFEISTTATKTEMLGALQHLKGLHIEDAGQLKIIHVPVAYAANDVLNGLVSKQITVNYFRDISTSTLKLFRENVKKN